MSRYGTGSTCRPDASHLKRSTQAILLADECQDSRGVTDCIAVCVRERVVVDTGGKDEKWMWPLAHAWSKIALASTFFVA